MDNYQIKIYLLKPNKKVSLKQFIKEKIPLLRQFFYVLKLSLIEKKIIPNHVRLTYSANRLYANPWEYRGIALLLNKGQGQQWIKKFWRISLKLFSPDIAIDVGANYGEIIFDAAYPDNTKKIIGIEANPRLHTFLKKSKKLHPANHKMLLINGLASNIEQKNNTFFIDKTSSGRSTALKNNFVKKSVEVSIPSHRIDTILSRLNISIQTIVFKVDVEGFEPYVLEGLSDFFDKKIRLIGCIEFNLTTLNKNNINIDKYLQFLNQSFHIIILNKEGEINSVKLLSIQSIKHHFDNDLHEGDLLLFSEKNDVEIFKTHFKNPNIINE